MWLEKVANTPLQARKKGKYKAFGKFKKFGKQYDSLRLMPLGEDC